VSLPLTGTQIDDRQMNTADRREIPPPSGPLPKDFLQPCFLLLIKEEPGC
jgi:hypothetical protein